jgi:hypothetical protein
MTLRAADVTTRGVVTIGPDADVAAAVKLLAESVPGVARVADEMIPAY